MTREEFIDIVYSELHSDDDNCRANRIIDAADEYAEKQAVHYMAIEALQTEPKTGGEWVPCSERLPEEFNVLCCDNHGEMLIAHPFECDDSDTGFSAETDGCYMYNCVAWMPLPKPYKESEINHEG